MTERECQPQRRERHSGLSLNEYIEGRRAAEKLGCKGWVRLIDKAIVEKFGVRYDKRRGAKTKRR